MLFTLYKHNMKRTKLVWFSLFFLLTTNICHSSQVIEISTKNYYLTLDKLTGDLIGLKWHAKPDIEIIKEHRLGENFRLLLPLPEYEANYFYSRHQQVTKIEKIENGVICHYDVMKNERQTLAIRVLYKIVDINNQLQFSISVDNVTSQPLAEVFYGIIGGQKGLLNKSDTKTLITGPVTNNAPDIFNNFQAGGYGGGNLGIEYSAGGFMYPSWTMVMPWMEIYNEKENLGLYYASHDTVARLSSLYFELRPFNKINVVGDNWPSEKDVPNNEPIGLTMGWLKFPYTKVGNYNSEPVVLQVHKGDWHEGSTIYRTWFDEHFHVKRTPSWLRNEQAWQSIIMSNSEDVVKFKFKDLPQLAADAKKYGVTTFEILGWDMGGIDRGYPIYEPDPRLGTRQEFKKALEDIKAIGVHPLIFTNIQWADTHIPLYKDELHKYTIKGRWEDDLPLSGWGEGTISSRLGFTRHNLTLISPSLKPVQQLLIKQYKSLIEDGTEGFQLDKALSLSMDFNQLVHSSPDMSFPDGLLFIINQILSEGRKINPNLSLAAESNWDRMFPYIDVSYMRMNSIDMNPSLKYTFPEWTGTIFAENPGDYNIMNNGMRYGLVWASAPRHYNKSMDEPISQPLSKYISELIRIRNQFKDVLFHGRFCDTLGADVEGSQYIRYSVFQKMNDSSKKACVIVNFGNFSERVKVSFSGLTKIINVDISQPFREDQTSILPTEISIPPQTCVVVVAK